MLPWLLSLWLLGGLSTSDSQLHFTQPHYNASIPENSARGTLVTSQDMMGMHSDACQQCRVTYRVVLGDPSSLFAVESRLVGDFWFVVLKSRTGSLNRERKDKYVLMVNGTVSTEQTMFETSTSVVVGIADTNDLSPLFYLQEYAATIPEDLAVHSSILKVFAEDADLGRNGEVYYSFVEVSEHFAVHPVTGVVSLMKPLRYSERSFYDLEVMAEDRGIEFRGGKPSSRAKVRIVVTQVNLHGPEMYVYHLPEILEHSHADVYAVVRVIDRDEGVNGKVQSLDIVDGDDNGHFRITKTDKPTAGVKGEEFYIEILKLASIHSEPNGYNLTLRAVDRGKPPRTSYSSAQVRVKDYNYNKPVFDREIYEIDVPESAPVNSSIIRLKILERDNLDSNEVLLEIVGGNEHGEFRINPVTGVLYTAVPLDAELKTFYTLTVSAIDHGAMRARKQSSAKVKIQVIDINDNDPLFESASKDVWINENEPAGTSTTKVTARDRDSGENAYISYSIANLNPVPFEIDHFTGLIRTTKVLDYESMRREYNLYIRASDWGTPFRRQSEIRVRVKVKDVNDNKPLFEKTDCVGVLPRQVPMDTEIITLSAIDLDAGNIISYRIASGNEDGCFSLDVTSGMLYVACDLSDVISSERNLNITAYDGTHFADFARVHIKLINSGRPRDFLVNGESASFDCKDLGVVKRLTEVLAMAEKSNGPKNREEDEVVLPNRYGANSHAPLFISLPNEIQINESVSIGTVMLRVKAVDKDLGYNGKLIFGITSGDVDSTFSINQDTGDLKVSGFLDREHMNRYFLNITVFDQGQPQLSSSRMISVVILDMNDNPPIFDKSVVSFKVKEDTPSGTELFQFKATDADLGENSNIWYRIIPNTENFKINSGSGILSVGDGLDRETQPVFEFKVQASDRASDPHDPDALHAYALVRVIIEDVNDEAPIFPSQNYLVKIREDLPVGTVVVTIDAWDPDLNRGGTVQYSFSNAIEQIPFTVDQETGTVRTTAKLDFEERQVYSVTLKGVDLGSPVLYSEVNLTIEITDVNENLYAPRFDDFAFEVSVRENLPAETLVTTLVAVDLDPPGEDSRVSYQIVAGSGLGMFSVDELGNIWTSSVLDRESSPHYWLTVLASDHGVAPLHSQVQVFVRVEDVNDNAPLAVEPCYQVVLRENSPSGTGLLRLEAEDADGAEGGQLAYSIVVGNAAGHFAIDSTGLIFTTTDKIDREEQEEYVLEVTITDSGAPPLASTVQVVITIEDENDNSPQFDQTFYHVIIPEVPHKDSTFIIQSESEPSESDLEFEALFLGEDWRNLDIDNLTGYPVFRLVAMDSDAGVNSRLQYQVKSRSGRFSVHPGTGVVYAQRAVPANHDYDLLVRASDGGSPQRRTTARVSVHVLGAQRGSAPSSFQAPAPLRASVTETDPVGYLLAVVQPQAPDAVLLWYSIIAGDPKEQFIIGLDSGSVQLAEKLDCEAQSFYNLTISVSDGHRTVYTQLLVDVIDSNEHRPQFSQREYSALVPESAAPGTRLVQLSASDDDSSSQLVYSLYAARASASSQLFDVNHLTGVITVAQTLDRETISEHVLTVAVSDASAPVKRSFARVVVHVADGNDHAPHWPGGVLQAAVLENAFVGSRVVTVTAVDSDHGDNAAVTYSIVSGNTGNFFAMDAVSGDISVARELDSESVSEFNLMVRAVDGGSTPLASTLPVFVTVAQSDQAPPRFETTHAVTQLEENLPQGRVVWSGRARSASALTYALRSGNAHGMFSVNPTTGVVTTRHALDYETTAVYNLTISAVNMAGVESTMNLVVDVLDCNDNAPRFLDTEYFGRIAEDKLPNSLVLSESRGPLVLKAEDADSTLLQYDIIELEARKMFYVDSATGAIRTRGSLDFERTAKVSFHVQVRDGGNPELVGRDVALVNVDIVDVNDCPPKFTENEYNTTVLLPTDDNVTVIQVFASDQDSWNITQLEYAIVTGNYDNAYSIAASSGRVTLKNRVPPLHKTPHRLKLSVSDGIHTVFAFVNIKWQWSSESSLRFRQPLYEVAVIENSTKVVTVAVVTVVGTELNEHVLFSVLNPIPLFRIGVTSGAVRTTGIRFDREVEDHYRIIVQARSQLATEEARVAQTTVTVNVLDVNDNCPVFTGVPYYGTVPVDATRGATVAKVNAIDLDSGENGEVRYELMRGHGELFRVHRQTGEIILKQSLEPQVREYQLSIAAYDGGLTPCSTEVWLHLTIVDRSLPLFDQQFYTVTVAEDSPIHTALPLALDTHTPHGMKLYYTIVAGNEYEIFSVDFTSGVLRLADELDFEDAQHHGLTVRATDLHSGAFTETQVNVRVTDVNDCYPRFPVNVYKTAVSEAAAPGSFVLKITASDGDTGAGGEVRYSVRQLNGNSTDLFTIEPEDGAVYLRKQLDREKQREHRLLVTATDTGLPNLAATVHLWIKVLDSNDNPPVFARSAFSAQLSSEAVRGQFVGCAIAWDPDSDQLQYGIVSTPSASAQQNSFTVDADTGVVRLIRLNSISSPLINISVSDGVHMAFTTVTVDILQQDDGVPSFMAEHYEVTIPENMAEPSFLVLLSADDTDLEGLGDGGVTYSIPSEKHSHVVSVDAYTGMLRSKMALDREGQASYEIMVMASDESGHAGFTTVRLTVSDLNDNRPIFQLLEYAACIVSNVTVDSAFLKVHATDSDQGLAAQLSYTVVAGANKNDATKVFGVHSSSGAIYLRQSAIGLEGQTFQFFVRASDRGSPPLHSDAPASVYIMQSSEEPPVFHKTDQTFYLPEDAALGYNITQLSLSSQSLAKFRLVAGPAPSPFSLSPEGLLYLSGRLDREAWPAHTLGVAAYSPFRPQLSTLTTVSVVLLDANDNRPIFQTKVYRASVAENAPIGTSVMRVEANDADEGSNGEVYYHLEGDNLSFTVDTFSGWIVTSGTLDRESSPSLNLTVVAVDNGSPPLAASAYVFVELVDCNDNPPVFSKEVYMVEVKEDAMTGSEILKLEVTDADIDSELRFYITSGDPELRFTLDDSSSGIIYLRRPLDRETRDRYELEVTVSDSKYTSTAQVDVKVLDVNDERPYCVQSRYYATLAENAAPGTYVLTVEVQDPDEKPTVNFHLTGEGAENFYLHVEKGELKTSKLLDRESMEKYSLKAFAFDDTFPDWECVSFLDITLTDINDNNPEFPQISHKVSVSEDTAVGTFVTKMNAGDLDRGVNRKLRYYLVNSGESHFEVDKDTAIVRLAKPLDREAQPMFTLIIKAVDCGMPQLWSLATLQVAVLDVNDNPPEFVSRVYAVAVPESVATDEEVVKIEAISKDTGVNAQVIYSVVEGNEQGKFDLHPITGVISVAHPIDYELTKWYLLSVLATDQGVPPLSSQATVNVTVLDTNDNPPLFPVKMYSIQVPEDVQVGEIILKLAASDADSGVNARIGYNVESGDSLGQFSIDLNTGELSVAKPLDRESVAEYMLTVRAADFGSPPLTSAVLVSINIMDVNDNPPALTQDNYTFFVQEDKRPGWPVGQLIVSDADSFPNAAPFSFTLLSGNNDQVFRVVSDGTLYTTAALSTRSRTVYYLQVRVSDSGFPPLHTTSWITVKVIEESQFAPELLPLEVFLIAYQERWPGGEIGSLVASDRDPYDVLGFTLEASTGPGGAFSVDGRRGALSAGAGLSAGRYRLNVSASDGKFVTYSAVTVNVMPLWEDMLQHSVSIRLRGMTAHNFIVRQWRSLVQLLESALLRQVSLTSLQAVHQGDLDVLLTFTGGVELATLSEVLGSAGLSGANWSCGCVNGALCRQRVTIQRELLFTVATDRLSFVCPGHSHQLYCACNLGFAGDRCEELLSAGAQCPCPAQQSCVPQPGPPGYLCLPPACPPSRHCPLPSPASAIDWEQLLAALVAVVIITCLVAVFVLYRRCHRISPGGRNNKSHMNHVIKRTSKLSNLQVTQQPSRPTSYTCSSNNELFAAVALNNVDPPANTDVDGVPADYRRNLMSPHHKINNDLKQTADIPMHQLMPPDEDTRTIGGYHWDCSDWMNGDAPQSVLTEVPDSTSYHSNDSCLTVDPARDLATLDVKLGSREDPVIPYGFPSSVDVCS